MEGMINSNNPNLVFSDHPLSNEELAKTYKYSSFNIILPTLFCLYQGLELLLKGFVNYKMEVKSTHDSEKFLKYFAALYRKETNVKRIFSEFINEPKGFIRSYMVLNNIVTIKQLYESFRYPDKKGKGDLFFDYQLLMYPRERNSYIYQVQQLHSDINNLISLSVELFGRIEKRKFNYFNYYKIILTKSKTKFTRHKSKNQE